MEDKNLFNKFKEREDLDYEDDDWDDNFEEYDDDEIDDYNDGDWDDNTY